MSAAGDIAMMTMLQHLHVNGQDQCLILRPPFPQYPQVPPALLRLGNQKNSAATGRWARRGDRVETANDEGDQLHHLQTPTLPKALSIRKVPGKKKGIRGED